MLATTMHACEESSRLDLTPCLLRAIEDHKYLRSRESCCEVDFLVAAEEFRGRYESDWRAAKTRADNAQQVQEMRRHLWIESEKAGRDVGRNAAGADWVSRYAREWRRHRESLEGNGFLSATIDVGASRGPAEALRAALEVASCREADLFVSQEALSRAHFRLELEPGARGLSFLVLDPSRRAELGAIDLRPGASLLVVAYGREAGAALESLRAALA